MTARHTAALEDALSKEREDMTARHTAALEEVSGELRQMHEEVVAALKTRVESLHEALGQAVVAKDEAVRDLQKYVAKFVEQEVRHAGELQKLEATAPTVAPTAQWSRMPRRKAPKITKDLLSLNNSLTLECASLRNQLQVATASSGAVAPGPRTPLSPAKPGTVSKPKRFGIRRIAEIAFGAETDGV
jgi:hypothetical protein